MLLPSQAEPTAAIPIREVAIYVHTREPIFIEALHPPPQRGLPAHTKARANRPARSGALARRPPGEKREVSTSVPFRLGLKQVIRADVVLIHGALTRRIPGVWV
jgi:hypothetical protein